MFISAGCLLCYSTLFISTSFSLSLGTSQPLFLLSFCFNPFLPFSFLFALSFSPLLACILIIMSLINIFQLIFICCQRHFFVHFAANLHTWGKAVPFSVTPPTLSLSYSLPCCAVYANRSSSSSSSFICFTYFFNKFPLVSLLRKVVELAHALSSTRTHT